MNSNTGSSPKVIKVHKDKVASGSVYIGRPSKWGNPFAIGPGCTREQAVRRYELWLESQPQLIEEAKAELKGKDLACFCAPQQCHGDILLRVANQGEN